MRRRDFIALLSGAASSQSLSLLARARSGTPTIGFLGATSPESYAAFVAGFRLGLKEAGFVDTQNVAIVYRWAEGQYDRLPELAADLVDDRNILGVDKPGFLKAQAKSSDEGGIT